MLLYQQFSEKRMDADKPWVQVGGKRSTHDLPSWPLAPTSNLSTPTPVSLLHYSISQPSLVGPKEQAGNTPSNVGSEKPYQVKTDTISQQSDATVESFQASAGGRKMFTL